MAKATKSLKRPSGTARFMDTLNYDRLRTDHQRQLNKINDVVVQTTSAIQGLKIVLKKAKDRLSAGNKTLSAVVPNKISKKVTLQRNLQRHISQLEDQIATGAYVQALVFAVTIVEDYLASNLTRMLRAYPSKLLISLKGKKLGDGESLPVDMRDIIAARTLDDLVKGKAGQRAREAMFAMPSRYLAYFEAITDLKITAGVWERFIEVKATRDLYVHGDGTINEIYLGKVGQKARGSLGDVAGVDAEYFDKAISCLKSLMSEVYVGLREKHCDSEPLFRLFEEGRKAAAEL